MYIPKNKTRKTPKKRYIMGGVNVQRCKTILVYTREIKNRIPPRKTMTQNNNIKNFLECW